MSKYIIDTETWSNLFEAKKVGVYGIGNDLLTNEKTVWSRMFRLDELEELNSDYINEHYGSLQDGAYQRGHDDGYEAGCATAFKPVSGAEYQRGFEDGKKSIDLGCKDCKYHKDTSLTNPCSECAREWKDHYMPAPHSDRIEVGDEVKAPRGKAIVTAVKDDLVHYFYSEGDFGCVEPYHVTKTGKHYDIASILEAMRK